MFLKNLDKSLTKMQKGGYRIFVETLLWRKLRKYTYQWRAWTVREGPVQSIMDYYDKASVCKEFKYREKVPNDVKIVLHGYSRACDYKNSKCASGTPRMM